MSRPRKAENILRDISPENLQRLLKESQRDIDKQLSGIRAQIPNRLC